MNIGLIPRTAIANKANAVLFVSLHCNASDNPNANGVEIVHHPFSDKGQKVADAIIDCLLPASGLRNRGVKGDQRGLAVLRHTKMPAVIIEIGFISNKKEECLMEDGAWLSNVADAIALGIDNYLQDKE